MPAPAAKPAEAQADGPGEDERRTLIAQRIHGDRHRAAYVKDARLLRRIHGDRHRAAHVKDARLLRRIHGDRHRAAHVKEDADQGDDRNTNADKALNPGMNPGMAVQTR